MKQTAEQIEARLAEITAEQAVFNARDFDAELSHAIVNGADVDALEEQQLQAERTARRLRVERQALEAALPEATREDAAQQVASLVEEHNRLRVKHHEKAAEVAAALTALEPLVDEFCKLSWSMRTAAIKADNIAINLKNKSGFVVDIPAIECPKYEPLDRTMAFVSKIHARLHQSNTPRYDQGIPSNLTYKTADDA